MPSVYLIDKKGLEKFLKKNDSVDVKNASEQKRDEIDRAVKNNYKRELRAINRKIKRNSN